jgi:hypothetical protein
VGKEWTARWVTRSGDVMVEYSQDAYHETEGAALEWAVERVLLYALILGLRLDEQRTMSVDFDESGSADFPHTVMRGPMDIDWACIAGPAFDARLPVAD